MIAGPSGDLSQCDNQGRDSSLLLKKNEGGKMERQGKSVKQEQAEGSLIDSIVQEFSAGFLNEERCRIRILRTIHKEAQCPRCRADIKGDSFFKFWENKRVQCNTCGRYFTALTDTVFSHTRMSFSEIVIMLFLMGVGRSSSDIADRISIDVSMVRAWRRKFAAMEVHNAG
jgi:transposase-like protein